MPATLENISFQNFTHTVRLERKYGF